MLIKLCKYRTTRYSLCGTGDVSYVSGPTGWTLTSTADGYTVAGATLKVHQNVQYKVKIAKLPATATSLAFKSIVTYGFEDDAQLRATSVTHAAGRMRFVATSANATPLAVDLNLAGEHNVRNALAAIAVGREVGVDDAAIARALAEFKGVGRRFQRFGPIS